MSENFAQLPTAWCRLSWKS